MSHEINNNNEESTVVDTTTVNQEDDITTEQSSSKEESKPNEKTVLSREEPKKSPVKKIILSLVTLAVVGGVGLFVYNSKIKSNEPSERYEPIAIDYTQIIDSWNKQVQNKTSKKEFLLSRESSDEMMEQLEEWMKNFYIPKITDSSEYNKFLEKNKFGKPTYFDTTMSKDEIRKLLKKATKEKVMSKIVKKVLMMNDIELWEELKK
jgi:hypothetical protein